MLTAALLSLLLSTSSVSHAADDLGAQEAATTELTGSGPRSAKAKGGGDGEGKKGKKKGGKGGKKQRETKLAAAEFTNSARTTQKGTLILSPLLAPSSYAVNNKVMVLVPVLPQLVGPQLGARYSFMNKKKKDLAVEPFASANWQFSAVTAGANVRYTMETGKNRLNLAAGAGFSTDLDTVQDVAASGTGVDANDIPTSGLTSTNLEIGYDLVSNDRTVWRFTASTDPYLDVLGTRTAALEANWNRSFNETFRASLGLGLYVGGSEALTVLSALGMDVKAREITPLPTVELWWKF